MRRESARELRPLDPRPVLAVLTLGDSFEEVWPQLADSADADLLAGRSLGNLAPLGRASAVLVAVAGSEARASESVSDARAVTHHDLAVVGVNPDHRLASHVLRLGATDYFALPADLETLRSWVRERMDGARAAAQAAVLGHYQQQRYDFSGIVGDSPRLRAALDRAAVIIPRGSATILITGETGTGKELLAQAIHYNGPRASEPFVEVNCTALPATLLEAELFGYEEGAFTDARTAKPGLVEAAHGGTILLDEIGDLPLELQAKLLKVLEDKRVRRLGALRGIDVDVRVVASTNVDLLQAVRAGRFREDLFYRLNVIPLQLPPLRERGNDVVQLAEHFLDRFAEEYELPRPDLSASSRQALLAHPWAGNVRELRNSIERSVLLSVGLGVRVEDLFPAGVQSPSAASPTSALPFPATLDDITRAAARLALERASGNKTLAAGTLGISRSRLYRLLGEEGEA